METLWLLVSQAHGTGWARKSEGEVWRERQCRERPGVCNSNGQIVIAERFDRWIMTSNDTPRWESKPPFPPACPMQPPSACRSPSSPLFYLSLVSSPCAASTTRGCGCGYEIASCICSCIWHRTMRGQSPPWNLIVADYPRSIDLIKRGYFLALLQYHFPCVRRDFDLVFYGEPVTLLDIYIVYSCITSRTRGLLISPIHFLRGKYMM